MRALIYETKYPLVAVVAMGKDRIIGDGKKMLWHIPQDLKRAKALTMGKPLIMGRRTYVHLNKRPLPGRANIVLTRNKEWHEEGALPANSPEEAVRLANEWIDSDPANKHEIIVFGGGEIYKLFMPYLTRIEATEIDGEYGGKGRVAFPKKKFDEWEVESKKNIPAQKNTPAFSYVRLQRKIKNLWF